MFLLLYFGYVHNDHMSGITDFESSLHQMAVSFKNTDTIQCIFKKLLLYYYY